jgi:hypothetical protein
MLRHGSTDKLSPGKPSLMVCRVDRCPGKHYAKNLCREHYDSQPERLEKARIRNRKLRTACFDFYGWKCVCCGESESAFLTIDHIDNSGAEDRRNNGQNTYANLKRSGFPNGFQTLCFNCNWAKSHGGCPHLKVK